MEIGPVHLTAEYRDLMPQREDLDLLGPVTTPEQDHELKDTTEEEVEEGPGHEQRGCLLPQHAQATGPQVNGTDSVSAPHRVKEVKVSDTERFVICFNPEAAVRDAAVREQLLAQLTELIDQSDTLSDMKRGELRGRISTKPGLNRYLRVTPSGKLRVDATKIKTEQNLDGKYLLRCSDPKMSAEDIALGYKQLLEVERGWRDMKSVIDLRPVYHRLEERIRAHVILCWLALLLIRIIETTTGDTWITIRRHLDRLHAGTFTGPSGLFRQTTTLSKPQRDLLAKLDIPAPKQIIELRPAPR